MHGVVHLMYVFADRKVRDRRACAICYRNEMVKAQKAKEVKKTPKAAHGPNTRQQRIQSKQKYAYIGI